MNRFILLLLILSSSYAEQTFAQGMEFGNYTKGSFKQSPEIQ